MMASDSSSPEPPEPSSDRPRLVINGVAVRPEDLCRGLPESVQRRLDFLAEQVRVPPVPESPPSGARALWVLGTVFLVLGLALALWLLWT